MATLAGVALVLAGIAAGVGTTVIAQTFADNDAAGQRAVPSFTAPPALSPTPTMPPGDYIVPPSKDPYIGPNPTRPPGLQCFNEDGRIP